MTVARLRRVGGSVMVAIPPGLLQEVRLASDSAVELTADAEAGTLSIRLARPRYTLAQLLDIGVGGAESGDREWLDDASLGAEAI